MKKSKVFKIICFFLIVIVLYGFLSEFLAVTSESDAMHISGFYLEPENSLDVVMIGPSEFYSGFSSPLAWKNHGFTSYAVTFAGVSVSLYKSMLVEALKSQNPKLVVFEINGIMQNDEYMNQDSKRRVWLDNMPWSQNKIDTIKSRVPQDLQYSYYNKMSKYHTNWQHPFRCMRTFLGKLRMNNTGFSYTKSFSTVTKVNKDDGLVKYSVNFTEQAETYLRELLDYCKEQGVENVLFVRFPHCLKPKNPEKLDEIIAVIDEYGYDYVNLENSFEEAGLDTKKDFYNVNHLNVYGMEKFTRYFGDYLTSRYDIKTEHSEEIQAQWNECTEKTENVISDCKEKIKQGIVKQCFETAVYK